MTNNESNVRHTRLGDPARLIALADGVFAIVMTLLVLDLRVPLDVDEAELQRDLIHHLP